LSAGRHRRAGLLAALFACLLAALVGPAVALAERSLRVGQLPRMPRGAVILGALDPSSTLTLTVTLRPRDPAALAAFAAAVSTPGSPQYRRFITVAQFARRFGASPRQIAAVSAALRARGLSVGSAGANGLSLPLRASVATLQRAFSTRLERVRLPGGRLGRIATVPPALPAAVAGEVQAVLGLSELARPAPEGLTRAGRRFDASAAPRAAAGSRLAPRAGAPQSCAAADAAASGQGYSGYTATQLAQAFGIDGLWSAGDLGQGAHIAVYELEGNFPADIAAYQACYGTAASVDYIPVDGGPPPPDPSNYDGLETELDVENLIAVDPQATIDVYQGPNDASGGYDTYAAIITADRDAVISTSWGLCEPLLDRGTVAAENTLFEEAAAQGQTLVSAAGDSGSEDCYSPPQSYDSQLAVDDPASQPFVTGVGGTSLSALAPVTQAVWDGGPSLGAGGGGISSVWPMPAYQSSAPAALGVVNADSSAAPCAAATGLCREVPDVSFSADPSHPYVIDWDNSWTAVGGTSGAAPYWAGLVALSEQLPLAARGCAGARLGFVNPLLYRLAAHREQAVFDDITSGENDMLGANGGMYPATAGYDMASGLGTFNAETPFALCDRVTLTAPAPDSLIDGAPVPARALSAQSSDRQPIVAWVAGGLPPGVSLSASGELSGAPAAGAAGIYHATIAATDADGTTAAATLTFDVIPSRVQVALDHAHWKLDAWAAGIPLRAGPVISARDLDVHGASFTYTASVLPAGLALDRADGYLSGTPARIGRYRVVIGASDGFGSAASTSIWTVYGRPRASAGRVSAGALSFSLQAGRYEPGGVRALSVNLPGRLSFARLGTLRRAISVRAGGRPLRLSLRRAAHSLQIRLARGERAIQVTIAAGAVARLSRRAKIGLVVGDAAGSVPVALALR